VTSSSARIASDRLFRRYLPLWVAWTLIGFFYLSQDVTRRYFFRDPKPWREVTYWMVRVWLSAALTPAILWLGRRWPIERPKRLARTARHLAASGCFAVVEVAAETAILLRIGDLAALQLFESYGRSVAILLIFGFHANVLSYWVVLGIQAGVRYYGKYQERELHAAELKSQIVNAQLSALKMQLQPHFLFNTLNAIMVLVRQQRGSEAEETLARLGDLLRAVLSDRDAQVVPLSRELEYLRLYLSIEQVRFSDRLRVDIDADPETLEAAVPHLGLQPVVENAVRHGIAKSAAAGSIRIQALRVDDRLEITVLDSGPGMPADGAVEGQGIGLANTRARLLQLYGAQASLHIASGEGGGTAVTMSIPWLLYD
jgi:two-component system LytT family sensor kinase